MQCPICKSASTRVLRNIQGYQQGNYFDICECDICCVSWSAPLLADEKIYDAIYKDVTRVPGYHRYYVLAEAIEKSSDPLGLIARTEDCYHAVAQALATEKKLHPDMRVAEVGCGQGYLTYSLAKSGLDIVGIDISENAIGRARSRFGEHYFRGTLQEWVQHNQGQRPTHVICTELIEHIQDPVGFLRGILDSLAPGGKLIVTTPHKHAGTHQVWDTDLPPVHLWWFSRQSMQKIGEEIGCSVGFFNFDAYYRENNIRQHQIAETEIVRQPILDESYQVIRPIKHDPLGAAKSAIKELLPKKWAANIRNKRRGLTDVPMMTDSTSNTLCAIYQRL